MPISRGCQWQCADFSCLHTGGWFKFLLRPLPALWLCEGGMNCRLNVVVLHEPWVKFTLPGLAPEAVAQFRQEDGGSSTSTERLFSLCQEKPFYASLIVKIENSGPGDRSGGHTGLRWVKNPIKMLNEWAFTLCIICLGSRSFGQDFFFFEIFKRDISTNTKLIPILLVPSVPVEGKEEFSNAWMGSGSDPAVPANKLLNGSALHLS